MEQKPSQNLFQELPIPHSPWSAEEPMPLSLLLPVALKLNPEAQSRRSSGMAITGLCPETDARLSPPPSLCL